MKKINIVKGAFPKISLDRMADCVAVIPLNACKVHRTRVKDMEDWGVRGQKSRNARIKQYLRVTINPFLCHTGKELKAINAQWYSLRHAYNVFRIRGYYLPKLNTKAVTGKYLYGVAKGVVYSWFSTNVNRAFTTESPTKADLVDIITDGLERFAS
jgi:hypothetical protein